MKNNKYFNEGLQYYLFLELGTKKDFINNIQEHGTNYFKYYCNESYQDKYYQTLRGNIYYPIAI